jgi:ubiquitin C-terminal hydrolase
VIHTDCCVEGYATLSEPFWILSTPIVPDPEGRLSLSYCLDALWASQEMELGKCPRCGHVNLVEDRPEPFAATHRRVLVGTPSFLIVHLMRLDPRSLQKDSRFVEFAEEISLPVLSDGDSQAVATYSLKAVAEHHGESREGGHYIAFVRFGSTWHRRSDQLGGIVLSAEVLGCQAYVLFYEKLPV